MLKENASVVEQSLKSRSALDRALEDARSGVSLELIEDRSAAHVAARKGQTGTLAQAFQQQYGLELPRKPGIVTSPSISAMWAGPDQWLVLVSAEDGRDLEQELRAKFGTLASIADQTDARTFVRVAGPASRATLAKLLPIDVHPRAFPPGSVAITHAAHIGAVVWRSDKPRTADCFMLACSRSFSQSFWHALMEAGAEFGLSVG